MARRCEPDLGFICGVSMTCIASVSHRLLMFAGERGRLVRLLADPTTARAPTTAHSTADFAASETTVKPKDRPQR